MYKATIKIVTKATYYEMEYDKVTNIEVVAETENAVLSEVYNKYFDKYNIAKIEVEEI